ncbi:HutD/Ves family protein [Azohydromonas australica]|uniref:HutD/Ves family protein n=1 Tax=Azohydromonas australica TaxID=364039 RepID=UPI0003FA0BF7|nr:HutD family protein [Azohydromonas australica]
MNAVALPCGVQRFALDDIPAEPWRNGGGLTRTIATASQGGQVIWRVSAADITRAGPFSRFPGMNRSAVLIEGERLELTGGRRQIAFSGVGHTAHFDGDESLFASRPEQQVRLWNVMTRRGQAMTSVAEHRNSAVDLKSGCTAFVLVLKGQYLLEDAGGDAGTLAAGEGLDLRQPGAAVTLKPASGDCSLIYTEIYSDT